MTDPSFNLSPLASVLSTITGNLKKHPVLSFVFGMAIILLLTGIFVLDDLRIILGGLLILSILGLTTWLFVETRKTKKTKTKSRSPKTQIELEEATLSKDRIIGRTREGPSNSDVKISIKRGKVSGTTIIGEETKSKK